MFKHSSSFTNPPDDYLMLESTLIAKKLATCQPSSLSLDDISIFQEKKKSTDNKFEKKTFTKPNPIITQQTNNCNESLANNNNITSTNKFAQLFGFNNHKSTKKGNISKPMNYELPNVKLIHTSLKSRKPIKIIELSPQKQ